jgi:agmatine/peptidylarginine deiminase
MKDLALDKEHPPMHDRWMPAEWAPQSAVLMAWPAPTGDFGPWYSAVEHTYIDIARAISQRQILIVACHSAADRAAIGNLLSAADAAIERIRFVLVDYDDIWVRDTAPLTTESGKGPRLLDFRFNGWGGKYDCSRDRTLAKDLIEAGLFSDTPFDTIDFVLEGGSIDGDGQGTLLTTRHCLLNPNRNPGFSQQAIEQRLVETLAADRILWLSHGQAEGDDTDAHVDTLARFCDPETIAYTSCDDPDDPQYPDLKAMESELRELCTAEGARYQLVPLPIPRAIHDESGTRLPATYANFLIINGAVLVPAYADAADDIALQRLQRCFPGREAVPIDCRSLIHQYGSLHCMTMQFPQSVLVSNA